MDEIAIIKAFAKDISRGHTINQIAKLIKKSYGYTHTKMHEFIEQKIFNTLDVGKSIYCTLNFAEQKTLALLALASIKAIPAEYQDLVNTIKKEFSFSVLFIYNGKMHVVTQTTAQSEHMICLSEHEFQARHKEFTSDSTTICYNHQLFWQLIGEVQ